MATIESVASWAATGVMVLASVVSLIGLIFWVPSMWRIPDQYKPLKRKK